MLERPLIRLASRSFARVCVRHLLDLRFALHMSAFGGKADIAIAANVKSRKYKERCSENA